MRVSPFGWLMVLAISLPSSSAFSLFPSTPSLRPSPHSLAVCRTGTTRLAMTASDSDLSGMGAVTKQQIISKFREMDKDSNGQLSPSEIMTVLKDMKYSQEEADCIYKQIDLNGDGDVSQDEFLAACQSSGVCAIDDDAAELEGLVVEGARRSPEDEELLKGAFAKMQIWVRSQPTDLCTGEVVECDDEEHFNRLIAQAGDIPVCVMFAAGYCRKCMALKPKYARIAQGYETRAVFLKCFIDKVGDQLVKERAGIVAVPTFQIWKRGQIVDKFVAGPALSEVVKGIVEMTDRHLDCGFSLMEKIDQNVEDSKAELVAAAHAKETKEITLGKAEVSVDALAAWRKAQAAKNGRRKL